MLFTKQTEKIILFSFFSYFEKIISFFKKQETTFLVKIFIKIRKKQKTRSLI